MKTQELSIEYKRMFESIIGTTIVGYNYVNENEGTYELFLSDGRKLWFSSCGDDMTYTDCGIE